MIPLCGHGVRSLEFTQTPLLIITNHYTALYTNHYYYRLPNTITDTIYNL